MRRITYITAILFAQLSFASISAEPVKNRIQLNHSSNILDLSPLSDAGNNYLAFAIRDPKTNHLSYTHYPYFIKKHGYFYQGDARLQGYAVPQKLLSNSCELTDIHLPPESIDGKASNLITLEANLDSNAHIPLEQSFDIDRLDSWNYKASSLIYDSVGNGHTLSLYFVKLSEANQWNIYITSDNAVAGHGVLTFNPDGTFLNSSGLDNIPIVMGTKTQYIQLQTPFITQFGSPFILMALNSDGHPAGDAVEEYVNENGYLSEYYTNGIVTVVSKIAVAQQDQP